MVRRSLPLPGLATLVAGFALSTTMGADPLLVFDLATTAAAPGVYTRI